MGSLYEKYRLKANGKRDQPIVKDTLYTLRRDDVYHIISENYSYKTETYYSILSLELEGKTVRPSSSAILDAYVVPICLNGQNWGHSGLSMGDITRVCPPACNIVWPELLRHDIRFLCRP